jgi:fatty-acyl-CoA synthase
VEEACGSDVDYQLTVPAIIRRSDMLFGERPIVSRDGATVHRYRYADMLRRAKQLAGALADLGVRPGDRVATLAWNDRQHLEAYFAVPAMGAVLHTLNVRLHARDLAYVIEHANDRVIILDRRLLPQFEQLPIPACVRHVIVIGDGELPDQAIAYEELLASADPDRFGYLDSDERSAAAMCYTSGTTGRPKGVVYSHRAIALQALNLLTADSLGLGQRDVVLAVVPMFHINGWCLPYAAALAGAALVLPGPSLDPRSLVELVASERVTISAGVPTVWLGVLEALAGGSLEGGISSLRALVIGGSAAPKSLVRRFQERYGVCVLQAWGMTETTSIATLCRLPPDLDAASEDVQYTVRAKQGTPAPFLEVRARSLAGLVPWDGETLGELEVRGPTVASQYYNDPAPDRVTDDGWFRTGDVVTIDARGYVEICDRSKDLIRSGGEWISSVALENALMGHPAVAEAAVVAIAHPRWGERPLAVVVLKTGHRVSAEELRRHLAPDFAKWWLPDLFEFVDQIPRTSTGKFLKSALRERFRGAHAETPEQR